MSAVNLDISVATGGNPCRYDCVCVCVCVIYITCLSLVVSLATPWDYHCTLLVQGALFSVPDVCVLM